MLNIVHIFYEGYPLFGFSSYFVLHNNRLNMQSFFGIILRILLICRYRYTFNNTIGTCKYMSCKIYCIVLQLHIGTTARIPYSS